VDVCNDWDWLCVCCIRCSIHLPHVVSPTTHCLELKVCSEISILVSDFVCVCVFHPVVRVQLKLIKIVTYSQTQQFN
jgi:hypothetical protein